MRTRLLNSLIWGIAALLGACSVDVGMPGGAGLACGRDADETYRAPDGACLRVVCRGSCWLAYQAEPACAAKAECVIVLPGSEATAYYRIGEQGDVDVESAELIRGGCELECR